MNPAAALRALLVLALAAVAAVPSPAVRPTPPAQSPVVVADAPANPLGARPLAAAPDTVRVLFVGASVTAGWYAAAGHDFPTLVVKGMAGDGRHVTEERWARPGARVADVLGWEPPAGMTLVVVHLVTNDAADGTPLATFAANYKGVLARIRESSPNARLVCLGAWRDPRETNRREIKVSAYDSEVSAACAGEGGRYVDLGHVYLAPGMRGPAGRAVPGGVSDRYHPNDAGHAEIARLVLAEAGDLSAPAVRRAL